MIIIEELIVEEIEVIDEPITLKDLDFEEEVQRKARLIPKHNLRKYLNEVDDE